MEGPQTGAGYPYAPPPLATPVEHAVASALPAGRPAGTGWRVVRAFIIVSLVLLLGVSVLLNVTLVGLIFGSATSMERITEETMPEYGSPGAREKIAVIQVEGALLPYTVTTWCRMVDKARLDERVKAVVLVVNSPGGGMTSADLLYHSLLKLRGANPKKPLVVSMADVAASGGVYIAMPANEILAQPTTITGSIGVMMPHINIAGLLERYGVRDETFVATDAHNKNSVSWTKETTPEGRKMVQTILDDAYDRFVSVVIAGRPRLTAAQVRAFSDGSVLTAKDAKEKGLIDDLGYFEDAVKRAGALAGLTQFRLVRYAYAEPFSLRSLIGLESGRPTFMLDPAALLAPKGPPVLYLWPGWDRAAARDEVGGPR